MAFKRASSLGKGDGLGSERGKGDLAVINVDFKLKKIKNKGYVLKPAMVVGYFFLFIFHNMESRAHCPTAFHFLKQVREK